MKKFKRVICLSLIMLLTLISLTGCGSKNNQTGSGGNESVSKKLEVEDKDTGNIPEINMSWGNELHTALPYVPIEKVDVFKQKGAYLNPLSEDKFELIKDDKVLAIINFIPTKGGSEVATMMGQNHLDASITSNTAMLTAIDSGTDIKILCPVQTGGVGMVFPPDVELDGWEDVKNYISELEEPLKLGYHSPISGPRILIESVLKQNDFKVTEDPNEIDADVLLVDLKGSNNLIPSITAGQVDAWVGPTAFPETAEYKNVGKVGMKLEQFPPKGAWNNFPCCVLAAKEESIAENKEAYQALVELIDNTCEYCMDERPAVAEVLSDYIGIEKEIIEDSTIVYTTNADDKWLEGIKVYVDALEDMNKFNNRLKGKDFSEVIDKSMDLSFIKNISK